MFVGMTSRGWGATGRAPYGLQRLSWNGKTPFEMKSVEARPDGFEITFTQPVDAVAARDGASYAVTRFTYQYHHNYGSPIINSGACPVRAIEVSPDRMKVRLVIDSLKLGYIHEIKAEGVLSADRNTLLHNFGYYTLNQIPDGGKLAITDANKVQSMSHHHVMNNAGKASPSAVAANAIYLTRMPASWKNKVDRTLTMGTKPGLKFDKTTLTVKAGEHVKLVFNNNDDMMHNMVITRPGAANSVGEAATRLGLAGERVSYVPAMQDVLFHTRLLEPTKSETIYFTAPDQPGEYPYICTFPGHYLAMRGVLVVTR